MKYRTLGQGLKVSAVGLGCMGMSHAYGRPHDHREMAGLIAKAVDLGYTLFDTAEVYGTAANPHDNEELVGAALEPYRSRVVIATKFGVSFYFKSPSTNKPILVDSRPQTIRRSLEASLKRLRTDYIDLYYQHRQDPNVPVEEVAGLMGELIAEGKILHWGLSAVDEATLRRAHAVTPVTAVQNRYSMMAREAAEALFPVLEELGVGLVAYSPMANGFLSGRYLGTDGFDPKEDYRSVMPQFQKEAVEQNRRLLGIMNEVSAEHGISPAQLSLAWMICKKPWIVPIPGTTKEARLAENAAASEVQLTPGEVAALDSELASSGMSAVFGGSRIVARN